MFRVTLLSPVLDIEPPLVTDYPRKCTTCCQCGDRCATSGYCPGFVRCQFIWTPDDRRLSVTICWELSKYLYIVRIYWIYFSNSPVCIQGCTVEFKGTYFGGCVIQGCLICNTRLDTKKQQLILVCNNKFLSNFGNV